MDNQRNILIAVLLAAIVLFGWDALLGHFYPTAHTQKGERIVAQEKAASAPVIPIAGKPTREGGLGDAESQALEKRDLDTALKAVGRVPIAAPGLSGSINLTGALVDDLTTNRHRATVNKNSGPARIFSPPGTPAQQFAQFGWLGADGKASAALPDRTTVWTASPGAKLTPQSPVTLTWTSPAGATFAIRYTIDADYLITATQQVTNRSSASISVQPVALINRTNRTASVNSFNLRSGPIGAFDDAVSFAPKYTALTDGSVQANEGKTDWVGFTDIYWMSTLIPDTNATTSDFRGLGDTLYSANLMYQPAIVAPGATLTRVTRLFAGAKESDVLDRYEDAGIPKFGLAIDWGWFRWFEKPIFWLLRALFHTVGNFGVAIILLTVVVRGIMFPIAQRQFASMAAMRAIQPKMKALQERYKDDKPKQQQEIMALYKAEKVNPLAGCLPTLLQIPVFFALYKVLNISIEMRHQPFVAWIRDLSAPDPLHVLNLFGLLPFDPPSFLAIGVLALLLGATMYFQFKLNPAATDPMQQQMFSIMPWVMMFVMAPFAAGLLLYWITSNLLTIAQQRFLYSRHPQLKAAPPAKA